MKKYHTHKELNSYYASCQILADTFLASLYPDEPEMYDDAYWIGYNIGEVISWGSWTADMNNIADYFKYKFTPEEFFEWYDGSNYKDSDRINMKTFKHLNNG